MTSYSLEAELELGVPRGRRGGMGRLALSTTGRARATSLGVFLSARRRTLDRLVYSGTLYGMSTTQLNIRVTAALKAKLQKEARRLGQAPAAYARSLLEREMSPQIETAGDLLALVRSGRGLGLRQRKPAKKAAA